MEELSQEELGDVPQDAVARVAWRKRALRTYRSLLQGEPARIATLRGKLEAFREELERAGLSARGVSRTDAPGVAAHVALREFFALLLGAPLAACGIAVHMVPYQLTAAIVRRLRRTDEEEATDKIATGLVLYPRPGLSRPGVPSGLAESWALAVFLVALGPLGFFALTWREDLDRLVREARAFAAFLRDRDFPRRLRERRMALAADLAALARLVPEERPG